jgi:hypothetical protein
MHELDAIAVALVSPSASVAFRLDWLGDHDLTARLRLRFYSSLASFELPLVVARDRGLLEL